ncbi:MAG: ATP-binding protein [Bacteroidales bacterium]
MFTRTMQFQHLGGESTFLWGARQTGKSTLLQTLFPDSVYFDLLLTDVFERLKTNPSILRETLLGQPPSAPVIIDEIQRVPELLNEVQWLIVNNHIQFILSGSSPRKILRSGANLLGGRALRHELYPLVTAEIPDFDLERALLHGTLPRHYLSSQPEKLVSAYLGNYLQDEIISEARIRNIRAFSRFLEVASFSNGQVVSYSNIAAESGVSSPTIKEYFQILEDTLIGRFLPSYRKRPKRRVIHAPKFYFFDQSIVNHYLKRKAIPIGSEAFGSAFEHFVYLELYAHSRYSGLNYPISYWRTSSQLEIDFVLGEHEVAIEVKGTGNIHSKHLKGLKSFSEEYRAGKQIIISTDPFLRQTGGITAMPWNIFLEKLWAGEIMK